MKSKPHLVLLEPSDVLFFRDGRPMSGGLAGHGAAWPLPNVINAAFHGALHRTEWQDVHPHYHTGRDGKLPADVNHRARKYGSLLTAGPFPVLMGSAPAPDIAPGAPLDTVSRWYFPRPADVQLCDNCARLQVALRPTGLIDDWIPNVRSSLPAPLSLAVANSRPPSKENGAFQWLEASAFTDYLVGHFTQALPEYSRRNDSDIFAAEFTVGIGIDPATQTQDGKRIYSAHYLRLRSEWRMGVVAACEDKGADGTGRGDLLADLIPNTGGHIIVGGQQRLCTAVRKTAVQLPLPRGLSSGFHVEGVGKDKRCFVKWVLLTPAVWPEMKSGDSRRGRSHENDNSKPRQAEAHPGGWLPNWIAPQDGRVLLRVLDDQERRRRRQLNYAGKGYASDEHATEINAFLVAALVPKAIPVTGWSFSVPDADGSESGAKTTHLAVPAGAIYYFEARGPEAENEALKLAAVLNWHGLGQDKQPDYTAIRNRRSTLAGEKGFGLGVCGTWTGQTEPPPHVTGKKPA